MKNLKCDYGWVQESNEKDADVSGTCMVPSVQIGLRYKSKNLLGEKAEMLLTHVAPIKF